MSELLTIKVSDQVARFDSERRRQLSKLMRIYERGLIRKAQALRVAVERGLREPLSF